MPEAVSATALTEFDQATAVRLRSTPNGADASVVFDAEVAEGWGVGPKPNGGYLLALVAGAAGETLAGREIDHPHPLAATAHYLRAPDAGPAEVHVDVLRPGRSASQVRAVLHQGGKPCVDATFTMGRLPEANHRPPADWTALAPPTLPPREACPRIPSNPPGGQFVVSIMDRADLRLDPATTAWAVGAPQGQGRLAGWISFADGRPIDPLALLFFLDALPPATFDIARSGWVPTLSLTAYLRAAPAPGPLRVTQRAQLVADGRVDEVCELWDGEDRLVGQATQLAGIRFDEGVEIAPFPN